MIRSSLLLERDIDLQTLSDDYNHAISSAMLIMEGLYGIG